MTGVTLAPTPQDSSTLLASLSLACCCGGKTSKHLANLYIATAVLAALSCVSCSIVAGVWLSCTDSYDYYYDDYYWQNYHDHYYYDDSHGGGCNFEFSAVLSMAPSADIALEGDEGRP
ncbi:hypothetical protein TeGR_g6743 [Tetraparma gracilis]|nr:hypothetical protein TeGR_g6743 [Tetraparma gracilis]